MSDPVEEREPREAVSPDATVGQFCVAALADILNKRVDQAEYTVLEGGVMYYLRVTCVGYRPPYEIREDGEYFGQRRS
jgi:hypothetical protein